MYPENVDKFTEKLNKLENNTYVIEEEISIVNGMYEGELQHDNISLPSIFVYTGKKLTGEKINNFILSTPSSTPWKKNIKIFANTPIVYVTYETQGDTVEAEDINNVQESIVSTQVEVNKYKASNNLEVGNLKVRTTNLENNKSEKTYVDTELNKRYLKEQVFTREEVLQKIKDVIGVAPQALDTLQEIAKSLNNDADFAGTITNQLTTKVDKVPGKQLSTEDYTPSEKQKLAGIETNANKYIHPIGTNPHGATKNDIGLGNVDNIKQSTKEEFDTHNGDNSKHVTVNSRSNWDSKANGIHDHDGRYYTEMEINNLLGAEVLTTLNKTLKGAINEVKATVTSGGSVANADTVDGKHASDFMPKGPIIWNNLKGV